MVRRFEHKEPGHNKFWEIDVPEHRDNNLVVRLHYGKIGTSGQTLDKVMRMAEINRLIMEKIGKGYKEVTDKPAAVKYHKPKNGKFQIDVKKMNRMLGNNNSLI
jgi:predicted DNA-binding WGR domain protein